MLRKLIIPRIFKVCKPDAKLEDMLNFAVEHVSYYKQFKGFSSLDDFPFLTKDIIRKEMKNMLSDDINQRKWYFTTSGGSTGVPIKFVQDLEYSQLTRWAVYESKSWAGYHPGDRLLKLWGSSSENSAYKRFKTKVALWLLNTVFLDTFELSEQKIIEYIQIIKDFKPKLIVGYASSLYEISKYSFERLKPLENIGAIVSSAGTLYPQMRQSIESTFGCKVYNRYGSREVGIIAAEDGTDKGLKLLPTTQVEIIREDGTQCAEGEIGEIAITSLANYAMPLIRYKIGDLGSYRIHEGIFYLEKVAGRVVELFKTKKGKLIDGEYFTHLLYFQDWVKKFRFRQVDYDYIIVEVVTLSGKKPSQEMLSKIDTSIKKVMDEEIKVKWRFLDEIKPLPSGKYVYTLSEVE
jgi:phenylacetate-CoA ligase